MSDLVSRVLAAIEAKQRKAQRAIDGIIRWDATPEMADFIADNDPADVLRRCIADRSLVEFWSRAYGKPADFPGPQWDLVRANARWTVERIALGYGISVEEETTGE